ncbi:MAG: Lrp/AsnC family transcriptional regulator [Candidatus Heimdallarchaeaceae archaeon]
MSVTPSAGEIPQQSIAEEISKIPQVYEIHIITGEYDIIAKVRTASVDELGKVVVNHIRNVKGVAKTLTNVSLVTLKEEVSIEKV